MEAFQEVKDRREKKPQQPRYQRKGAARPQTAAPAGQNADVHMKDEEKQPYQKKDRRPRGNAPKTPATVQAEQPAATAAPLSGASSKESQEEEKKQAKPQHHHNHRHGKQQKPSHIPSEEAGFTGPPEEWFDGMFYLSCNPNRYLIQEAIDSGPYLLGQKARLLFRQLLSLLHPRGDAQG